MLKQYRNTRSKGCPLLFRFCRFKHDREEPAESERRLGRTSYPAVALRPGVVRKPRHGRGSRAGDLRASARTQPPVRRGVAPRPMAAYDPALHLAERTPSAPDP